MYVLAASLPCLWQQNKNPFHSLPWQEKINIWLSVSSENIKCNFWESVYLPDHYFVREIILYLSKKAQNPLKSQCTALTSGLKCVKSQQLNVNLVWLYGITWLIMALTGGAEHFDIIQSPWEQFKPAGILYIT